MNHTFYRAVDTGLAYGKHVAKSVGSLHPETLWEAKVGDIRAGEKG